MNDAGVDVFVVGVVKSLSLSLSCGFWGTEEVDAGTEDLTKKTKAASNRPGEGDVGAPRVVSYDSLELVQGDTNGTSTGKSDSGDILSVLVRLALTAWVPLETCTLRAALPLQRPTERPTGYTFGTFDFRHSSSSTLIRVPPDRPGTAVGEGGNT